MSSVGDKEALKLLIQQMGDEIRQLKASKADPQLVGLLLFCRFASIFVIYASFFVDLIRSD